VPIENNYITGFDFLLHRLTARHGPEFAPVNRAVEFARIDEDVYQTVRRGPPHLRLQLLPKMID